MGKAVSPASSTSNSQEEQREFGPGVKYDAPFHGAIGGLNAAAEKVGGKAAGAVAIGAVRGANGLAGGILAGADVVAAVAHGTPANVAKQSAGFVGAVAGAELGGMWGASARGSPSRYFQRGDCRAWACWSLPIGRISH